MNDRSVITGEVVDGTVTHNRTVSSEAFNTVLISFRNNVIPVLFSEFLDFPECKAGDKIIVTGTLMSDWEVGKPTTYYFYASKFELTDIDAETNNEINFDVFVTKVKELTTDGRGRDILPLMANKRSPLHTTSVLQLCAIDETARKLSRNKKGFQLSGKGYLKSFRDIFEILITSINE